MSSTLFCLENRRYQVLATQRSLRRPGSSTVDLEGDAFDAAVESKISANFTKYQDDYKKFCQDWTQKNIEYQTSKADMVSKVLGMETDDVKAEVSAFFKWEIWWKFFRAIEMSGCMSHYVSMCVTPTQEARRRVKELLIQKIGDQQTHWLYYKDDPRDVMGMSSSLLEARSFRRKLPVELRAGGHMFLRH